MRQLEREPLRKGGLTNPPCSMAVELEPYCSKAANREASLKWARLY